MFLRRTQVIATVAWIGFVLVCMPGSSRAEAPSESRMLALALEAFDRQEYDLAESHSVQFLERFPKSTERLDVLYLLGRVYFLQDKFRKAREAFLELINDRAITPQDQSQGLFWLAEACARLERWDEAKAYYLEFVDRDSADPWMERSLFALGLIFFREEAFTRAEAYFSRGVTTYPNGRYRSQQQYYRGLIYSRWRDYHRAVQLLREALFSPSGLEDPLRKNALFYLAENRLQLGQLQLALPYYRDFYENYPNDPLAPVALYRAGWCELKAAKKEAALTSFQRLIADYPKSETHADTLYGIGEIRLEEKDYESAMRAFRQIATDFPDDELLTAALINLGWCHLNLGDLDEAIRVAHRLLKLPTTQAEKALVQWLLGEAHFQKGRYKEALPYFFNLLNTPPQRENALYKISQSYFFEEEYKDAITNVEILLLEYPDAESRKECLYLRGRAAFHLGDTEKAIASFSAIVAKDEFDPWKAASLYELGKIYYERKDLNRARDLFSEIVHTAPGGPTSIVASYYLGIIYSKEADSTSALAHLHNALASDNRSIKAECHYRIGRIYFHKRAFDLSLHHFERILETLPDQSGWTELALFQIGIVRLAQGHAEKATQAFQKVLEISKDPDLREASEKMLAPPEI